MNYSCKRKSKMFIWNLMMPVKKLHFRQVYSLHPSLPNNNTKMYLFTHVWAQNSCETLYWCLVTFDHKGVRDSLQHCHPHKALISIPKGIIIDWQLKRRSSTPSASIYKTVSYNSKFWLDATLLGNCKYMLSVNYRKN